MAVGSAQSSDCGEYVPLSLLLVRGQESGLEDEALVNPEFGTFAGGEAATRGQKARRPHFGKRRAAHCESTGSVRLTWEALQKPPWLGEWETGQVDVKAVASGRKSQTERKQLADAFGVSRKP